MTDQDIHTEELKRAVFRAKPSWVFAEGHLHPQFGMVYYVYDRQTFGVWIMTPFTRDEKLLLEIKGSLDDAKALAAAWKMDRHLPDEQDIITLRVRQEIMDGAESDYEE